MSAFSSRALLALLILTWAVSWPVIKIGVMSMPPIWFATLRYVVASACLFAFVALRRNLVLPPRGDWPLVVVSGALQMGAYSALTALALTMLPPGRASVLAFSTPIWVAPLASGAVAAGDAPSAVMVVVVATEVGAVAVTVAVAGVAGAAAAMPRSALVPP